jgi:hypothetical protein
MPKKQRRTAKAIYEQLKKYTDFDGSVRSVRHYVKEIKRLIKRAGFPTTKTLDNYDFKPISFPDSIDKTELLTLDFIDKKDLQSRPTYP